jgi:hypothetical protein
VLQAEALAQPGYFRSVSLPVANTSRAVPAPPAAPIVAPVVEPVEVALAGRTDHKSPSSSARRPFPSDVTTLAARLARLATRERTRAAPPSSWIRNASWLAR